MDYIISPWFFYFSSVFCKFSVVFATFVITSFIFIIAIILYAFLVCSDGEKEEAKGLWKYAKPLIIAFIVSLTLYIVTPEKETMYMMQASKLATYENVEMVGEALKDGVEDVLDVIHEEEED